MTSLQTVAIPLDQPPMEAKPEAVLPSGEGWQYEPKWDGFRCLAFVEGGNVELMGKSGKPLTRYFPEVVRHLQEIRISAAVLDGELVVPVGEALSFEALQMRLHPARSRIDRLARETPAVFVAFDCLASPDHPDLREQSLSARRAALERLLAAFPADAVLRLSPMTLDVQEAQNWLDRSGQALDGIVAKHRDGPYEGGRRAMIKVKLQRTADCVVAGFRRETGSSLVGSLLLGLYGEDGLLHHVGFTSGLPREGKPGLTARLEALEEAPGFTGRAPGGPSRWSTERSAQWVPLRPVLVAEVRYDQVTGDRFRHGTGLLRWRPDKAPRQCTFDQLSREARPGLIRAIAGAAQPVRSA